MNPAANPPRRDSPAAMNRRLRSGARTKRWRGALRSACGPAICSCSQIPIRVSSSQTRTHNASLRRRDSSAPEPISGGYSRQSYLALWILNRGPVRAPLGESIAANRPSIGSLRARNHRTFVGSCFRGPSGALQPTPRENSLLLPTPFDGFPRGFGSLWVRY
jgi:hypothetical protein